MPTQKVIAAIDIGTDKCATVIAVEDHQTGALRVVGLAAVPSRGVKRSQIIDLEQVFSSINDSLDAAERMAGVEVKSAYVSTSGSHIASQNSKGVVAVASPNQEVAPDDVARVIEAARAISLPSDREVIHILPKSFKVDSQDGIKDPVGMTGVRLETEAHIITGLTTALKNLEKCILDLGVSISGFVYSGLASSEVVLTETEKELGVVSVDFGAGSTALCAYVDGALEFSATLPIGARHITQDIALGCRVGLETAEKIKLYLSESKNEEVAPISGEDKQTFSKRKKQADEIRLADLGILNETEVLSKKTVIEGIMTPRMKELAVLIGEMLEKHNLFDLVPAGLVITGGGAQTVCLIDTLKQVLRLPARVGEPERIPGLAGEVYDPAFATSLGLITYGIRQGGGESHSNLSIDSLFSTTMIKGIFGKVTKTVKSFLP